MKKTDRKCKYCDRPHPVSDWVAEENPFCAVCLQERVARRTEGMGSVVLEDLGNGYVMVKRSTDK